MISLYTASGRASARSVRRRVRGVPAKVLGLALAAGFAIVPLAAHAQHDMPRALPDLVAEADTVAVARLVSTQARWNARGNLIVTDYRFVIERDVLAADAPGQTFVLSQGGGTIGDETHALSSNPKLETGARYLVFLRPDRGEVFAPFVGGAQGIYALDDEGRARALSGTDRRDAGELLGEVDHLVQQRGHAPARVFVPSRGDDTSVYPSKAYVPSSLQMPAPGPGFGPYDKVEGPVPESTPREAQHDGHSIDETPPWVGPRYHYGPTISAPVVYDEYPHDWEWSPHDQYQMSAWNSYSDNVFRISGSQLGTWSWGNGRFELVGWPSNQTMIDQFGEGWGATTLAVTWSRWNGSNVITEADIAFNPAYCWTREDFTGANPDSTCWSFQQTMLHELGHGWGLDHPWEHQDVWWDSVMNYAPKAFRLARLSTDDVNAIRNRYGSGALFDVAISQYRTSDSTTSNQATYTASLAASVSVTHGGTLSLGAFQIENLGTTTFANPSVDIYLNQNWNSWTDTYRYLRTANFTSTMDPFSTHGFTPSATTIPSTIPTGVYYPTLWLDAGDPRTGNNTSSSRNDRRVTVRNAPPTLAPVTGWRTAPLGRIGPQGTWEFALPAVSGRTYELSTCSAHGGSATFDTIIEIIGAGVSNDDFCGLQSRLQWTAPSNGTRTVRVRPYGAAQGTFVLAYREVVTDTVFSASFD